VIDPTNPPLSNTWMFAVTFVGLGAAMIIAAWLGFMLPKTGAYVLGSLAVLVAPIVPVGIVLVLTLDHTWMVVGVGLAAALVAASVVLRSVPMRILGSVGVLGYLAGLTGTYYADSPTLGLTLAIAGPAMLVGALLALWMYEPGLREGPEEKPSMRIESKAETKLAL
jgi:hypothetical protein